MPSTLTLIIDAAGVSENVPFTFDFTNLLWDLGSAWTLTGTPVIAYSPNDASLTITGAVIDSTKKLVQAYISASLPGTYHISCRATCTNGTSTAIRVARGLLRIEQWQ